MGGLCEVVLGHVRRPDSGWTVVQFYEGVSVAIVACSLTTVRCIVACRAW